VEWRASREPALSEVEGSGFEVDGRRRPARLTQPWPNGQTTKLCGARLDSPAAVLLDDSPA